jgi:DNA polymerase III delta prime subunit
MILPLSFEARAALIAYHESCLQPFRDAVKTSRLAHAWILYGPPGCGAEVAAQTLVAEFLTRGGDASALQHLSHGTHPDVMIVEKPEDKTGISVEAIRDACSFLSKTSSLGAGRALIIAGAEIMTRQAANALLKRLEEPSAGSLLILTTSALGALPLTLRSRCWRLRLKGLDQATFSACLPSVSPETYHLHSGNLESALQGKLNTLDKVLHQKYTKIVVKARSKDSSVLSDLDHYDTMALLLRDAQTYHLDAETTAVVASAYADS